MEINLKENISFNDVISALANILNISPDTIVNEDDYWIAEDNKGLLAINYFPALNEPEENEFSCFIDLPYFYPSKVEKLRIAKELAFFLKAPVAVPCMKDDDIDNDRLIIFDEYGAIYNGFAYQVGDRFYIENIKPETKII